MKQRLFKVVYTDKFGVSKLAKIMATNVWQAITIAASMDLLFEFARRTYVCQ